MASHGRSWANITIMVFGIGSIVVYAMLSLVINTQPATSPNTGWVAVLQPETQLGSGRIALQAKAVVPGAPGNHPSLVYSVLACGDQPFHGILLLGGQAQLDPVLVTDQHLVTSEDSVRSAPRVSTVPDLVIEYDGTVSSLGPVQKIPIVIDQPTPCADTATDDRQILIGTGTTIAGLAHGPIQRSSNFWGIKGARTSQVWPLIGGFPPAPPSLLGRFTGIEGLQGDWSIPAALNKEIVGGSLTTRSIVDGAIPPLSNTSELVWDSSKPFSASVRVTNIDELNWWQNWLMGGGIVLGVGASLLASLLFEWLRPAREARFIVPSTPARFPMSTPHLASAEHKPLPESASVSASAAFAVVAFAVVAYVLRRRRS